METKRKIILASSSPRRVEILKNIGVDFDTIPSDYEEFLESLEFSYQKIETLAFNKALCVFNKVKNNPDLNHKYSIILSADTVVILDNQILGKPKDKEEAINMLKKLSGHKHMVVTSVCAINLETTGKKILSETSYIEFEELAEEIILNYVEKFSPLDKAGAYGIQELPNGFIKSIEGSFKNIMGLCPEVVKNLIR